MKLTEENLQKKHALSQKLGTDKNTKVARPSLIKSKSSNGQKVSFVYFNYLNTNELMSFNY